MTMPSAAAEGVRFPAVVVSATARAAASPTAAIGSRPVVARVATRSRPTSTSAPGLTRCGLLWAPTVRTASGCTVPTSDMPSSLRSPSGPNRVSGGLPPRAGLQSAPCQQGTRAGDNQLRLHVWPAKTARPVRRVVGHRLAWLLRRPVRTGLDPSRLRRLTSVRCRKPPFLLFLDLETERGIPRV